MCGRFTLSTSVEQIVQVFGITRGPAELPPRYNIAPTQDAPVVRERAGERRLDALRWGLIPPWTRSDEPPRAPLINARAETAARKPSFRRAISERRCLVPADGFYEWERTSRARLPLLFRLPDGGPFALAGLWERWDADPERGPVESFTILTTEANALVAPYHDRMPVVIPPEAFARWLDPALSDADLLQDLLAPFPAEAMQVVPLDPYVNDVRHEGPACLARRLTLFDL